MNSVINELSVVVLNYNDYETTSKYVESIKDFEVVSHIIIVDNCSTDESYSDLLTLSSEKIDVIKTPRNGGYGYGNNFGMKFAIQKYKSPFIAVSNPDVIINEETIKCVLDLFEIYNDAGIAVPMMTDVNGKKNYRGVWKVPTFWQYLLFSFKFLHLFTKSMFYDEQDFKNDVLEVGCVAGSFLIIKTKAFQLAGTYDENIFLYCEETSLGIKMKNANYKSYLLTNKVFIHAHSVSIKKSISSKVKRAKLMWDSREYVLTHYWNNNIIKKGLIKILKMIGVFEAYVYYLGK